MGAYCLIKHDNKELQIPNLSYQIFSKIGLIKSITKELGPYTLVLYQKILWPEKNYYEYDGLFIGAIGSPVYKGLSYEDGLRLVLDEFIKGILNIDELIGHYYLFIWNGKKLTVISDGGRLIKSFHDKDGNILTSSFLFIVENLPFLTVNKDAAVENLTTGGIGGPHTLFHEINEKSDRSSGLFSDITFIEPQITNLNIFYNNKHSAIKGQLEILDHYFSSLKTIGNKIGVDNGLTGGMDSRLLLSLSLNHFNHNVQIHSHRRLYKSIEWEIAKEIAETLNLPFLSPMINETNNNFSSEYKIKLEQGFLFYDGLIRKHCYWDEEYNSLSYRLKILEDRYLGLNGIGGEQYRNGDRYIRPLNIYRWIEANYFPKTAHQIFNTRSKKYEFLGWLAEAITNKVSEINPGDKIDLLLLKKIQNEYIIPAYRGARTHAEAKVSFFLSPFADTKVSYQAYSIVPFLGKSVDFEREMILKSSPLLSSFISDYGFPFSKKEPITNKLLLIISKNILPIRVSNALRDFYKKITQTKIPKVTIDENYLYGVYIKETRNLLHDRLDFNVLLDIPELAPLIIELGYLLKKYNSKIIINA